MKSLSKVKKSTIGIVLGCLFIIIQVVIHSYNRSLMALSGYGMLDMTYYLGRSKIIIDAYLLDGIEIFNLLQILDLVFIVIYGCLLINIIKEVNLNLLFLPKILIGLDLLEDIGIRTLIHYHSSLLEKLVFLFTIMKFIMVLVVFFYILHGIKERWLEKRKKNRI